MPTPETPTRPFNVWSFCRTLLSHGMAIQQDYEAGKYRTYEDVAARLDEAAREREAEAAATWNTRHLDPATRALARLGAAHLSGVADRIDFWMEAVRADVVPDIRDRVAELLHDTEARERREDTDNA